MDTRPDAEPAASEPSTAPPSRDGSISAPPSPASTTPPAAPSIDANELAPTPTPTPTSAPRRRGHRAQSSVWRLLTDDAEPHKATVSVCRHCRGPVPHHHKSEKARAHLKRCAAFRQNAALLDAKPDWLLDAPIPTPPTPTLPTSPTPPTRPLANVGANAPPPKRAKPSSSRGDLVEATDALAMFLLCSGAALALIEHPQLRRALAVAQLPLRATAQELAGPLLERAVAATQCELIRLVQRPRAVNAVCVNSWLARDAVYSLGSARVALFVDRAPRTDDSEAGSHALFDHVAHALSLCGDHVHGVVTDNAAASQLMWARFKSIFPDKFFHGCAAHGLYLFVEQIFGSPLGAATAFADLRQLVDDCRALVEFFSSPAAAAYADRLAAKLAEGGLEQLEMPPQGQWLALKNGFESVLVALPLLQELAAQDAFARGDEPKRRVAAVLVQPELEAMLFKAVALVDPLDSLMKRIEREPDTPISDVFYWFAKELPVALSRVPGLTEDESAYLLKLNQTRFNSMYGDSHGIAYLLDPRYVGEGLSADVRKNIEDLIFHMPLVDADKDANADEQKIAVAQQLTEYVIDATQEKTTNSFRYSILVKNKKSVLQYWLSDGLRWPLLQKLAVRLFSLPSSTLPMTKRVLSVPFRPPPEELPAATLKKIQFIQVNQALLQSISTAEGNSPRPQ